MFFQGNNIGLRIAGQWHAFSIHKANGHLVNYRERLCDNVSTIELVANHARADGVTVQADKQVKSVARSRTLIFRGQSKSIAVNGSSAK